MRTSRLSGGATELRPGTAFVLPGLQELHLYDLRDQVYRADRARRRSSRSRGCRSAPTSRCVTRSIRPRVSAMARELPADIDGQVVAPAVQGVIYRVFTRYTVREIFSSKRAEIQQVIEAELRPKLAADGVLLRGVQVGKIDLPPDYKRGMEALLGEELESEKMRYTLELKDKQVRQAALEADAEKVRRESAAEGRRQ